jgi:6-phosphogluconate dehydrogenase
MTETIRSFGIVGLGKMGGGIARNALAKGLRVVGVDTHAPGPDLLEAGLTPADIPALRTLLPRPRFVMLYVPAGPLVDTLLDQLADVLEPGDIVGDSGNSYWGDSIRRHARMKERQIHFIDIGTSGGPGGAASGACFMIGGEADPVRAIEPLLRSLAVEGGYVHAGGPGAGHFVKLVHNGIEFGMLQAIGEGMELLTCYRETLRIPDILACWSHGSVIRSWLIDLMREAYVREGGLNAVPPYVEDTGEVNWLVDDALHLEATIPVITLAVIALIASRDPQREAARAVAMMRHGFGGHPYGADAGIARERHTGRVGGFVGKVPSG